MRISRSIFTFASVSFLASAVPSVVAHAIATSHDLREHDTGPAVAAAPAPAVWTELSGRVEPTRWSRYWQSLNDIWLALRAPGPRPPLSVLTASAAITTPPVAGMVTSRFGQRRDPFHRRRRMHRGLDFAARKGTPVNAAGPGVVVKAGRSGGYGRLVIVNHGNGVETRYAHLHRINVKPGQLVDPTTVVGLVGSTGRSTGPHLHFEVRKRGRAVNPLKQFPKSTRLLLELDRELRTSLLELTRTKSPARRHRS
jgi:murein DD-endopeptidase MepM/ murein hydrolase activator NlpD